MGYMNTFSYHAGVKDYSVTAGGGQKSGATSKNAGPFFFGYFVLNQFMLPTNKVNTMPFS